MRTCPRKRSPRATSTTRSSTSTRPTAKHACG
jgi:hypothetical protein